jgi:hypothetical protein
LRTTTVDLTRHAQEVDADFAIVMNAYIRWRAKTRFTNGSRSWHEYVELALDKKFPEAERIANCRLQVTLQYIRSL